MDKYFINNTILETTHLRFYIGMDTRYSNDGIIILWYGKYLH